MACIRRGSPDLPERSRCGLRLAECRLGAEIQSSGRPAGGISKIMNGLYPQDRFVIDLMLAHTPKDKVEAACDRQTHMPWRRDLAQAWAHMLLECLQPTANLLDFLST